MVRAQQLRYAQRHPDRTTHSSQRIRKLAIVKLGGKCQNPLCRWEGGCTDYRCLQIDHINGGGVKEHKAISSAGIYRRVLAGEPGYQLLCANCNWIKRFEKAEHR